MSCLKKIIRGIVKKLIHFGWVEPPIESDDSGSDLSSY